MNKELIKNGDGMLCPIAVFLKDNKILVGRRNYTQDTWKEVSVWTVPGGRSETGENIEQTLRREVAEEVGITEFEIIDFIAELPGAKKGDTILIFYCKTNQDAKLMEPEKFSEWKWISIEEYMAQESVNPLSRKIVVEYILNLNSQ